MMKALGFTILFVLAGRSLGFTQHGAIDSLKHELIISKIDTNRVRLINEIANLYKYSKPDSSLFFSQQALILSRKCKYPNGEFNALFMMGFTYSVLGNYPRAFEIELKALRIAEKYHNLRNQGQVYIRMGVIYRDAKDYAKSILFFRKAKLLFESIHLHDFSAVTQNNLSIVYFLKNQPDSAQYFVEKAFDIINHWKVEWYRSPNLLEMGRQEAKKGSYQLALNHLNQSLKYAYVYHDYFFTTQAYLEIARIYQQTNHADSCIFYAQKALFDAQKGNVYNEIVNASLFLSTIYQQKNPTLAFQYLKIALDAKEKLSSFGNLATLQNQVTFDEEERLHEIEAAKAVLRSQIRQYASLAGLGVFLLVAFILHRNNRQKQKANVVLQEQKERVESTLSQLQSTQAQLIQSEKLASLGELTAGIAHEIQNPLNFVNNFAEVSAEMIGEMEEELDKGDTSEAKAIAADLKTNLSKINHHGQRASSIVKGMLEHSRASTGVKEPTDLNALADEYLRLSYHGFRAKDDSFNATMETHFDPDLPWVSVIPQDIGRVLLNLSNNAFYAVAERSRSTVTEKAKQGIEGYQPTVTISSQKLEDAIEIRVQDNGNGIPEAIREKIFQPFFTTKPTGQGTGLGLSLAYDIVVKGHGGSLEVLSTEREGTEFIIQFPAKNNG